MAGCSKFRSWDLGFSQDTKSSLGMELSELRVQGSNNNVRIFGDNGQEGSSRRLRRASSTLPVLDCIQTEAEGVRESGLRHLQSFSDALYIDFGGEIDLVTSRLSGQKGIYFVQSIHQVVKDVCHRLPLVLHWTLSVKLFVLACPTRQSKAV